MSGKIGAGRYGNQRGSVAVEAAIVAPILVLLVIGGVHFGKVLMLRHKLASSADVATRSAAIASVTDSADIQSLLETELGAAKSMCGRLAITTRERTNLGVASLEVEAVCTLNQKRFFSISGFLGPDTLSVKASMPL